MELWSYSNIGNLSCPSTANIEIVALSFQALEFWAYFYKHWNSHLIVPNTGILPYFYTHLNVGILAVRLYTDFFIVSFKTLDSPVISVSFGILILSFQTCNSGPISIGIGVMILFNQTLQFWPSFCTHWNFSLIFRNMRVLALLLETLILSFYCKHWNFYTHWFSDLILQNIGILDLFLWALEWWS